MLLKLKLWGFEACLLIHSNLFLSETSLNSPVLITRSFGVSESPNFSLLCILFTIISTFDPFKLIISYFVIWRTYLIKLIMLLNLSINISCSQKRNGINNFNSISGCMYTIDMHFGRQRKNECREKLINFFLFFFI